MAPALFYYLCYVALASPHIIFPTVSLATEQMYLHGLLRKQVATGHNQVVVGSRVAPGCFKHTHGRTANLKRKAHPRTGKLILREQRRYLTKRKGPTNLQVRARVDIIDDPQARLHAADDDKVLFKGHFRAATAAAQYPFGGRQGLSVALPTQCSAGH